MENLRVRRAGFCYRRTYEMFLARYKCVCPDTWPNYRGYAKDGVRAIVSHLGYHPDEYRFGELVTFLTFRFYNTIDLNFNKSIFYSIPYN